MIRLVYLSLPLSSSDTPLPPILSPSSEDIVEAKLRHVWTLFRDNDHMRALKSLQ
jgi:hypothetical protein